MCATCGCGEETARIIDPGAAEAEHRHPDDADQTAGDTHAHAPAHGHPHGHAHGHGHEDRTHTIELEQAILAKNDQLAGRNRAWLARRALVAVNVMSSPGAGKTTVLERTIADAGMPLSVIEGDQETTLDADRIRAAGARTVQINTGSGCHLDAAMVARALTHLDPAAGLVVIENVGNLVCPALFDLGETGRVVIISVTEGDDKPLKYPHMFSAADLIVVNKIDLLPYVDFDVERLTRSARHLRPGIEVVPVSARTGENMNLWYAWLHNLPLREHAEATSSR